MNKWNKSIKAAMWAKMIQDNIARKEEINFTRTITQYFVIIGGMFLFCVWSLYFVFNI